MSSRFRQSLPLLLILLMALVLRVVNLNTRPVWYDEAFSVLYAQETVADMLAGTLGEDEAAADIHPLLYYSGLHGWMNMTAPSHLAARSLSVILGLLTIFVLFLLTLRLFDRRTALTAAFIAAIAPFAVYYHQEARMYVLLGLFAITTVYFLVRAIQGGGWFNWVAFAATAASMLYTHNLGLFFLAGLELWLVIVLLDGRRQMADGGNPSAVSGPRSAVRSILFANLLILLLYLPWLLVLPRQLGKLNQAYWVTRPGITELIQTLLIFHFGYDNQALPAWLLPPALLFSLLIPALLILVLRSRQNPRKAAPPLIQKNKPIPHRLILLLILAVVPVLAAFLVSQVRPVYVVRAFLPSALMYYILVAYGFVQGGMPRLVKWGVAIPALAIIAISLFNHYQYQSFPRPPFAQAMTYLAEEEPGRIIHSNKLTYLPAYYYAPELNQQFIADEPGSGSDTLGEATQTVLGIQETKDLVTATAGAERVWFVVFKNALDEWSATGREHPHLAWLRSHYQEVSLQSFNDLLVFEFSRR